MLSGKPSNLQYSAFPCWLRRAGRFWPERKKRSHTVEYYNVSPSECSLEMCSPWMLQPGSDPGLCLLWPPWLSWWPRIHHQICREMITTDVSENSNANKKQYDCRECVAENFHVNKICDLTCIWGAGLCQDTWTFRSPWWPVVCRELHIPPYWRFVKSRLWYYCLYLYL